MRWINKDSRYFVRLEKGEEIVESIATLCRENYILTGSITGIGAVDQIEFGLFEADKKQYHANQLNESLELTSLMGNISTKDDDVYLHLHVTVAKKDGTVCGGHLNRAVVSLTCEIVIDVDRLALGRRFDETIGLNLWEF